VRQSGVSRHLPGVIRKSLPLLPGRNFRTAALAAALSFPSCCFLARRHVSADNMTQAQAVHRAPRLLLESGMNIGSVAQQSYVGATQQASAMAPVSPDSFSVDSTRGSSKSPATSGSTSASSASLSSQTLQALMDLLQSDPADSSSSSAAQAKRHHHHGGPQPATASNSPASPDPGAEADGAEARDNGDAASLATALGV
jgi:hypothetical protein